MDICGKETQRVWEIAKERGRKKVWKRNKGKEEERKGERKREKGERKREKGERKTRIYP